MTKKTKGKCDICGVDRLNRTLRDGMCRNCRRAFDVGTKATLDLDRVFYNIDQMRKAVESLRMNMLFEDHPVKADLGTVPDAEGHVLLALNCLEQASHHFKLAELYHTRALWRGDGRR